MATVRSGGLARLGLHEKARAQKFRQSAGRLARPPAARKVAEQVGFFHGMRVLLITIERPYPPVAGAELRDWQNIAAAMGAGPVAVAFLSAPEDGAPPPRGLAAWHRLDHRPSREIWNAGGQSPIDVALSDRALAELDALVAAFRPEVAVLEHTQLHALLPRLKAQGLRVVVDMHNVESRLYANLVPPRLPLKWLQRRLLDRGAARIRAIERRLLRTAEQIWLCSEDDRRRLARLAPPGGAGARLAVVPNGLPPGRLLVEAPRLAPPLAAGRPSLLFLGHLGYPPNVQAVRYLIRRVAPLLARRLPAAEILVAGRAPSRKLASLVAGAPNMRLLADPPDVAPLLRAADLMLAPLFKGSGTRLKVLEAWAAGLPLVATPLAVEGLGAVAGVELALAPRARAMVSAAADLLEDPARYAALSAGGLARVRRDFTPERIAPRVRALLAGEPAA